MRQTNSPPIPELENPMSGIHAYHPDAARRTPVPTDSYYDAPEYDGADYENCEECGADTAHPPLCRWCSIEGFAQDVADDRLAYLKEN